MKKINNHKEFNKDNALMVIEKDEKGDQLMELNNKELKLKSRGNNIVIGKLNLIVQPFRNRHKKYYSNNKFHLWADIFLVVLVVVLIGAVLQLNFFVPTEDVYINSRVLSDRVISGKKTSLIVDYGNKSKEEIHDGKIAIILPENFMIESVEPKRDYNQQNNVVAIGNLTENAHGKIKINGTPLGDIGSRQSISFSLNYEKNGKNFQVLNSSIFNLEDSALKIEALMPETIYQNVDFNSEVKIINTSERDFENVLIVFGEKMEVKADERPLKDNILEMENIKSGEMKKVALSFLVKDTKLEKFDFNASVYLQLNGMKLKQNFISKELALKEPSLKLEVHTDNSVIKTAQEITYKVNYKNIGNIEIDQVKFIFNSTNDNFDLVDFKIMSKNLEQSNGSVRVGSLSPGTEGSFSFNAKFNRKKIDTDQLTSILTRINYKADGQEIQYYKKSNSSKVISDYAVSSVGYYFSPQGDQLGAGPLPPTIGIPTNYWVVWSVENFGNDLTGTTMGAVLPDNVVWLDTKNLLSGSLHYFEAERKVMWTIDKIDKKGGENKARFEIAIMPTEKDLGKTISLLIDTKFRTRDVFCGQDIDLNLKDITTDLQYDMMAKGKSKVVNQ